MSDQDAKKTYRLYALPLTAQNIGIAATERFSRATPTPEPGYVLIYTCGEQPQGATEIDESKSALLTQQDLRWLMDSGAAILAEEIEKNTHKVFSNLSESVERLEEELARAKQEGE